MTEHVHDDIAPATVADIDAENGSWNHLLPVEDWEAVVAEADRIYTERVAAETEVGGSDYMPLGLTPRRVSFPDTYGKNSGSIVRQQLWVIHTAECPLRVGYAESLTKWGNGGYQPRASWPKFVDPATVVSWISTKKAAFLHGPANSLGMGWEQAGYARFTRAEWLVPDGLRQLDLLAQDIVANGITKDAVRWLSDAQVNAIVERRDTTTRGLCTHAQIVKYVSRTDPGKGYPKDVLLDWIKAYHPAFDAITPRPPQEVTMLTTMLVSGARTGETRSRGPEVELLQRMLNALIKAGLVVDGSFGPRTETAVKKYQGARGLKVDGRVGPATRGKLNTEWTAHNAPKPAPTPTPTPAPTPAGVRYVIDDPDRPGRLKVVPAGTSGSRPARDLDEADGNYLAAQIDALAGKLEEILDRVPSPTEEA